MSKLQKSKTLSLGRLATLSTIKGNLNVKTSFQKSEQLSLSPHGVSLPRDSQAFAGSAHLENKPDYGASDNNRGPDDSPPLVFSAISKYRSERSFKSNDGVEDHDDVLSSAGYVSSSNDRRAVKTSSTEYSHLVRESQSNADNLVPSSSVKATISDVGHPLASTHNKIDDIGCSSCDGDLEPSLFQSKLQRLYSRSSNYIDDGYHPATSNSRTATTAGPEPRWRAEKEIRQEFEAHEVFALGDAEIEKFRIKKELRQEEEIISSRSSSGYTTAGDNLEDENQSHNLGQHYDDEFDEEYWSVPAKLPGLALDERDLTTGDKWIPRHPDLVRVKGYHPLTAEAPLSTLMHFGFLTPTALHFVHNHGQVPRAAWDNWSLEITGLVKTSMKFTMRDLLALPSRRVPVTLMCAGNRRKELCASSQSSVTVGGGLHWGAGAISTSVWGGAALRDVLLQCGVVEVGHQRANVKGRKDGEDRYQRYFVRLLGADNYGTSIPLEVAMDESRDVLLAYEQNMDLLTPDHGFPVRLIVPGFTAGRSVKWLQKIEISELCSDNSFHVYENRMLPSHVKDLRVAFSEGWLKRPEFGIGDMNVTSVISTPAHNTNILSVGPSNPMTDYSVKGFAYCGAGKSISRVEMSLDGGQTWELCHVDYPEKPNKFGKSWCWCFWKLKVNIKDLSNSAEVVVRAWDAAMNTQTEQPVWNILGVMNNCWYRVKIVHELAIEDDEPPTMTFQHPTQPGKIVGGWMQELFQPESQMERVLSGKQCYAKNPSPHEGENSERTPRPWRI